MKNILISFSENDLNNILEITEDEWLNMLFSYVIAGPHQTKSSREKMLVFVNSQQMKISKGQGPR